MIFRKLVKTLREYFHKMIPQIRMPSSFRYQGIQDIAKEVQPKINLVKAIENVQFKVKGWREICHKPKVNI